MKSRFKWARAFKLLEREQKARNRKLKNIKKGASRRKTAGGS